MTLPTLKDQSALTLTDFSQHPAWVRAQDYDHGQSWYDQTTDQTYRPWDGPLPLEPATSFPFVFLAAEFRLSNGQIFPGYFKPVTEKWDDPLPPRKMRDGTFTQPLQWSARHGGTPLSVLSLHAPVVFINDKPFDFHLRRDPETRKRDVLNFYAAIGLAPQEVFPIEFSASPTLFNGIVAGHLDGFYTFPLNRPFEIDTGQHYREETS